MICIWTGNDLEERGVVSIISHWKKALNEGAAGAKGAAYSTNSCQLHNEHCWKANLILQPERLPCINELLPMERRSMTKTAWRQGGDVTPPLKHWALTVYISRPICNLTKPAAEPWQYIQGHINNNNDHVIKRNHGVALSFYMTQGAVGHFSLTGLVAVCSWQCVWEIRTTSSSESSRPWMLLLSRTVCWCLLPLVWLNRCTSEVIYKHKHIGQRSLLQTQWRQRQERVNRAPLGPWWNCILHGLVNGTWPASTKLSFKQVLRIVVFHCITFL